MTKKQILEAIERHCNTECNLDGDEINCECYCNTGCECECRIASDEIKCECDCIDYNCEWKIDADEIKFECSFEEGGGEELRGT